MMVTKRTYYKALFLLIAFSLGTVVGFACSMSSIFHGLHHHNSDATAHHEHQDGTKHDHSHSGQHHDEPDAPEKSKDDCCSTNVLQLQKTEKAVSRSIEAPNAIVLAAFVMSFSHFTMQVVGDDTFYPHSVRWRLPATIQDLRIVIQSFQI
jgi:hypothetical protein